MTYGGEPSDLEEAGEGRSLEFHQDLLLDVGARDLVGRSGCFVDADDIGRVIHVQLGNALAYRCQ